MNKSYLVEGIKLPISFLSWHLKWMETIIVTIVDNDGHLTPQLLMDKRCKNWQLHQIITSNKSPKLAEHWWINIVGIRRDQQIDVHELFKFPFHASHGDVQRVGTKGVSQNHLLSFDDNKVLKIVNWIC